MLWKELCGSPCPACAELVADDDRRYPEGVKFIVASFEHYFGNVTGTDLRSWCSRHGWVLVWTHVVLGDPRRLVDPVAAPHSTANVTLSPTYVASFASLWAQAEASWSATQTNLQNQSQWQVPKRCHCAQGPPICQKQKHLLKCAFLCACRPCPTRQSQPVLAMRCFGPSAQWTARTVITAWALPTRMGTACAILGGHEVTWPFPVQNVLSCHCLELLLAAK